MLRKGLPRKQRMTLGLHQIATQTRCSGGLRSVGRWSGKRPFAGETRDQILLAGKRQTARQSWGPDSEHSYTFRRKQSEGWFSTLKMQLTHPDNLFHRKNSKPTLASRLVSRFKADPRNLHSSFVTQDYTLETLRCQISSALPSLGTVLRAVPQAL